MIVCAKSAVRWKSLMSVLPSCWTTWPKRCMRETAWGLQRLVVVIDCGDQLYELINPEIIAQAGALDEAEGCLSSPGEYALVRRPEKVAVRAQDRHGKEFVLEGDHLLARAICHECDHLDGRLFKDIAIRMLHQDEDGNWK